MGSKKQKAAPPAPHRVSLPPDTIEFEEASLRLQYHSMSSHGVRLPHVDNIPSFLPKLLESFAANVEVVEPLDESFQNAATQILRPQVALEWTNAHLGLSKIGRHALYILESLDGIDVADETFGFAMLYGELHCE